MKLLLTAFEPFNGEVLNPSLEAIKLIKNKIRDIEIIKLIVPVEFGTSIDIVRRKIIKENPNFILCIGQAGGRSSITIERVAININDASIEDNAGNKPIDESIFNDGENAYFSNLPIKRMVNEIKKVGIPSNISNSAGTYVCNQLLYGVLYTLSKFKINARAGFIHVPYVPEQVINKPDKPSMSLEYIVKGIEVAINALSKGESHEMD